MDELHRCVTFLLARRVCPSLFSRDQTDPPPFFFFGETSPPGPRIAEGSSPLSPFSFFHRNDSIPVFFQDSERGFHFLNRVCFERDGQALRRLSSLLQICHHATPLPEEAVRVWFFCGLNPSPLQGKLGGRKEVAYLFSFFHDATRQTRMATSPFRPDTIRARAPLFLILASQKVSH